MRSGAGFTLIEVMIALAIFAIAAVGMSVTFQTYQSNNIRLQEKTVAHWIAQNTATRMRVMNLFPPVGKSEQRLNLAGRDWYVEVETKPTQPIPNFREINIRVGLDDGDFRTEKRASAELVTYLGEH